MVSSRNEVSDLAKGALWAGNLSVKSNFLGLETNEVPRLPDGREKEPSDQS